MWGGEGAGRAGGGGGRVTGHSGPDNPPQMTTKNKSLFLYDLSRAQELCESRDGRPGLPPPNKPTVSVDVKQHSSIRSHKM